MTGCRENTERDSGWDDDDEDLKRGLVKQDSLEFTRARLAKKKADRKIEHLRELAARADVDSVIDENCKVKPPPHAFPGFMISIGSLAHKNVPLFPGGLWSLFPSLE